MEEHVKIPRVPHASLRNWAFLCVGVLILVGAGIVFFTPASGRIVIRTEPVDVRLHTHNPEDTHYDHMTWAKGKFVPSEDMWLTSLSARIEGAPHGILHTAYVMSEDEEDARCPLNPRFLWSGSTVTTKNPKKFEPPYGLFVTKGQELTLEVAFHNGNLERTGEDYTDVTLALEIEYEPADTTSRSKPLSLVMLDAAGCNYRRPVFTVPPRAEKVSFDTQNNPFIFKKEVEIVGAGAHFHASYDKNVENTVQIFFNDELLDEFTTNNISDEQARNPRLLEQQTPLTARTGDRMWIRAIFDNPSDVPVYEGMASVGFYYYIK